MFPPFDHQTGDFEQTLTTGKTSLRNEQWKIWTFLWKSFLFFLESQIEEKRITQINSQS